MTEVNSTVEVDIYQRTGNLIFRRWKWVNMLTIDAGHYTRNYAPPNHIYQVDDLTFKNVRRKT